VRVREISVGPSADPSICRWVPAGRTPRGGTPWWGPPPGSGDAPSGASWKVPGTRAPSSWRSSRWCCSSCSRPGWVPMLAAAFAATVVGALAGHCHSREW
jgi:hypothetical protein